MSLPPVVRKYMLSAISGTPDVLESLLQTLSADDPRWDFTPDPDRFTLREVVAHLADWEPIHLLRATRIRDENEPTLEDIDENQLAIDNDYAHSNPHESLARFRQGRTALLEMLRGLSDAQWERTGNRIKIGLVTTEILATLILGHDGYHTQQVAEWLNAAKR